MPKRPSSDVVGYAAGFFDGEGHIDAKHLHASMSQNIRPPLEFIQTFFGGRIQHTANRSRNNYELHLYGANCREFLEIVLPYLLVKDSEAREVLSRFATHGKYKVYLDENSERQIFPYTATT